MPGVGDLCPSCAWFILFIMPFMWLLEGNLWPPSFSLGMGGKAGLVGAPPPVTLSSGGGPGLGALRSVRTFRPPTGGPSGCLGLAGTLVMLTTAGTSPSRGSLLLLTLPCTELGTITGSWGGSQPASSSWLGLAPLSRRGLECVAMFPLFLSCSSLAPVTTVRQPPYWLSRAGLAGSETADWAREWSRHHQSGQARQSLQHSKHPEEEQLLHKSSNFLPREKDCSSGCLCQLSLSFTKPPSVSAHY